ncbi:MAG: lipoyl-dependent peroxiredoxin [Solirubrobacteraceae bacterium]|nr:lipoyl-dependent peroxiredoxin [Solirubrobacteraceae bacterium]
MGIRVVRTAHASWQGTVPEGSGKIGVGSGAFDGTFTLRSRIDEGVHSTNPEELIGAGHAGCFTMSLANLMSEAGHPPNKVDTTARVHLEELDLGFRITKIELDTVGDVDGMDQATFVSLAKQAKTTCPVSLALTGTEITLKAKLKEGG